MSVLGHLLSNFETREEDLATEALHYIVTESEVGREALVEFINQASSDLDPTIFLETQTGAEEGGIPDMVGKSGGEDVLYIESKFHAGLTDYQPEGYLKSLPDAQSSACLFITPRRRVDPLWTDLLLLCERDEELVVSEGEADLEEFRAVRIGKGRRLAICSWSVLLDELWTKLNSNNETEFVEDINQLKDFCKSMDREGFRPLRREDLSPRHGRRILDFYEVMSGLRKRLDASGIITKRGQRKSGRSAWYYRVWLDEFPARLLVSYRAWNDLYSTPFWVAVKGNDSQETAGMKKRLEQWGDGCDAIQYEHGDGYLYLPLFPPTNVEKTAILDDLFSQVEEIRDYVTT